MPIFYPGGKITGGNELYQNKNNAGQTTKVQTWSSLTPNGNGANYEMKADYSTGSGANSNITIGNGAWYTMNVDRWFSITDTLDNFASVVADITIVIREIGNVASEVSNILTIEAQRGTTV